MVDRKRLTNGLFISSFLSILAKYGIMARFISPILIYIRQIWHNGEKDITDMNLFCSIVASKDEAKDRERTSSSSYFVS